MNLLTQISLSPEQPAIDFNSRILLLGSCFSENIGGKLDYFKLQNWQNPFGIVFNPISIQNLVVRALNSGPFERKDVFNHNGIWSSFEVHSSHSSFHENELLDQLNNVLESFRNQLSTASHIIITLGSSWIYRSKETQEVVANCHKVPQTNFYKELLSIDEIVRSLSIIVDEIKKVNPTVALIFTISPVRHIKDGIVENAISKAHLIAAVHQALLEADSCHYFPSYELMMDELRDYRFYADDMIHPSELAIQYIWEKFKQVWVLPETEDLLNEIDGIQKGLAHRPFHPESEAHLAFVSSLKQRMMKLQEKIPQLSFMI
jgi:GSCFA family